MWRVSQKTLNLGILAHVDAGKTTLTERLLYDSGVIDQLGAVDAGTTQTDSLPLEQRRGITIKSAVTSFPIEDVAVNLIDTPGHPDFIAEVDRVLNVLDGVVLVVSAVEGVQAQTRILMRSLQRLQIPALLFVNKIDRSGANPEGVLRDIASRLKIAAFAVGCVTNAGTRGATVTASGSGDAEFTTGLTELLVERNDRLLAAYVHNEAGVPYEQLRAELAEQTRRGQVYPVFFGSAITGAGIAQLTAGIAELLPASDGDPGGPLSGSIFKIERGSSAEKIAYARMFSGTVHVRDRLRFGSGHENKVTAVAVFERGPAVQRQAVSAGQIGKLWGLAEARIGDRIYIERPLGRASAVEVLQSDSHPYSATVGLHIEPGPAGSGVRFRLDFDPRLIPLYIYKTAGRFADAMTQYVLRAFEEGLYGWQVSDCAVTMTECGYYIGDGPTKRVLPTPRTTAADFRKLTPLVLMEALRQAGTVVCQPMARVRLELPAPRMGDVLAALGRLGAATQAPRLDAELSVVTALLPSAQVRSLQEQLPGLTGGEGVLDASFGGYEPVHGTFPRR